MGHNTVIVALDLGSTGHRALAFTKEGHVVASSYKAIDSSFPQPAWVEQDPMQLYRASIEVLTDIVDQIGVHAILGIGISNQRETSILWDKHSGKPLYQAISWQCRRTATRCRDLSSYKAMVKEKTGLFLDPYFSATKIEWLFNHVPEAQALAKKNQLLFGTVDSWLLWQLTKGKHHATDVSNASRTLLFNIHTCRYDHDLLKLFHIPEAILPRVYPSSYHYGELDPCFFKKAIPILAIIGDQQAALFAQCGQDQTTIKNTYGTGLFVVANTGKNIPKTTRLVNTIAWQIDNKLSYALEGSIFSGTSAIQWLQDELGLIQTAAETEELSRSINSSAGVMVVPAFTGLGAPHWDASARGLIIGLRRDTTKAHIIRATLEALAFQSKEVIEEIKGCMPHQTYQQLHVDGGASKNAFLMQYQADILNMPVARASLSELTAFGAAGMAGITAQFWTEKQFSRLTNIEKIYQPQPSNSLNKAYSQWKKAVERSKHWVK